VIENGLFSEPTSINGPFEKSIIEKTIQYLKDRTQNVLTITFHARRVIVNKNNLMIKLIYSSTDIMKKYGVSSGYY
jgi:hypothetical protein